MAPLRTLVVAMLLLAAAATHAHSQAVRGVLGNGGTVSTNGAVVLQGTAGQAIVGRSAGVGAIVQHGFWTHAGTPNVGVNPAGAGLPQRFEVGQARPSPARGNVRFALRMPRAGDVDVAVFDAAGRRLPGGFSQRLAAGAHELAWSAQGSTPGIYFARFAVNGQFVGARRLVLVK